MVRDIIDCMSNAMHGQNINLPVQCMCVSVSVCLSHFVNSPTGQTPQRIFFTVDSLTYADLRKDVPFGNLDDD